MADRHPIDRALDCLADYERAIKGDNYNVNPDYPADVRDELAQWWAYNGDLEAEYRDLLKIVKEIDNRLELEEFGQDVPEYQELVQRLQKHLRRNRHAERSTDGD